MSIYIFRKKKLCRYMRAQKVTIQNTLAEEGHILALISLFTLAKFKHGMKAKFHDMFNRHGVATPALQTLF